jgi:hypothetical protein
MLLFFILTNLLIGFILTIYAFVVTDKEHRFKLIDTFLLTFFLPSIGFGLWDFGRKELKKEKHIQVLAYYIFNKMAVVHVLFVPTFFVLLLMDFYILGNGGFSELLLAGFVTFIFSIVYFIFIFFIILVAILPPFLIANMIYKKKDLDTLDEGDIDMNKWERATPPIDKKDLSYQVDDEYISLADDEDDEIIIDLD